MTPRTILAIVVSVVGMSALLSDDHASYPFSGRVCKLPKKSRIGKQVDMVTPDDTYCRKPLDDVTVTINNSQGVSHTTRTNHEGYYSLPEISLHGTEEDKLEFRRRKFASFTHTSLEWDPSTPPRPGVIVFLVKSYVQKVRTD